MKILLIWVLLIFSSNSLIGQKNILLEKFTNVFCGSCPNASILIEGLVEEHPNIIWIKHFKPVSFEEIDLENDQSVQLWWDLAVPGVPHAMVDRVTVNNKITHNSSAWENLIIQQLAEPSFASISIDDFQFDIESRNLEFQVDVIFDRIPEEKDFHLSIFIEEDTVYHKQYSYYNEVAGHPLEGKGDIIWAYKHHHVVRAILDDAWGSKDVIPSIPEIGKVYSKSYSYQIPADRKPHRFGVVAAVNEYDANNINGRKVLNAERVSLKDLSLQLSHINDDKQALAPVVEIFPNPSTDFLTFKFKELPSQLTVHNQQGELIQNLQDIDYETVFEASQLSAGVYYLSIQYKTEKHHISFIIN